MKPQITLGATCFLFSILTSCHSPKPEIKTVEKKKASLVIGNPLDIGIENSLIFPVGSDYNPEVYNPEVKESQRVVTTMDGTYNMCFANNSGVAIDRYSNSQTEYVNNNENEFDIRNILFYDRISGKTYQLISDTMHILSFAIHKDFATPLIFYRVVKKDSNKDTVFNSSDPVMLYTSDIYGKHLTKITPDNEQFVDYYYYPETQKILTKTRVDSDADGHFSTSDETNFREVDLKTPAMGREIFTKSLKDSLRIQGNTY
jgi:hypothetical protein